MVIKTPFEQTLEKVLSDLGGNLGERLYSEDIEFMADIDDSCGKCAKDSYEQVRGVLLRELTPYQISSNRGICRDLYLRTFSDGQYYLEHIVDLPREIENVNVPKDKVDDYINNGHFNQSVEIYGIGLEGEIFSFPLLRAWGLDQSKESVNFLPFIGDIKEYISHVGLENEDIMKLGHWYVEMIKLIRKKNITQEKIPNIIHHLLKFKVGVKNNN